MNSSIEAKHFEGAEFYFEDEHWTVTFAGELFPFDPYSIENVTADGFELHVDDRVVRMSIDEDIMIVREPGVRFPFVSSRE